MGQVSLLFHDSFSCFKTSLESFADAITNKIRIIPLAETLEVVKTIELGIK